MLIIKLDQKQNKIWYIWYFETVIVAEKLEKYAAGCPIPNLLKI